jgi:hypothetical protein
MAYPEEPYLEVLRRLLEVPLQSHHMEYLVEPCQEVS